MKITPLAALAMGIVLSSGASSQDSTRTKLAERHPLVGTWRIDIPELKCFEEYEIRPDGTKSSVSGAERNESEFAISPAPGGTGVYKWTDKITKTNGKPDCSGATATRGHVAVSYVRLHSSGKKFFLCRSEDMKSCFAEVQKVK
ncbi:MULTISPECIES: hypothetical protein [unclassified Polaromonas]|uniref:hypothetical protein n=1 Tax=unclassified Polaromonas TaxID=2638319 RepID=UPI00129DB228|nr:MULTISPECIES: hypothetical protein [unclassified Polaromonas]QGJ20012.1 hypothetical protein F7R28_17530 [Polaromonas sp. Pch-P]